MAPNGAMLQHDRPTQPFAGLCLQMGCGIMVGWADELAYPRPMPLRLVL